MTENTISWGNISVSRHSKTILSDLMEENEQLKERIKKLESDNKEYIKGLDLAKATSQSWASDVRKLREENCRLEKKNKRLIKKIKQERASTTKQFLKWSDESKEIINDLRRENEELKQDIEYLEEKIKENEWHWNTIDEDRDVWHYKCTEAEKRVEELKEENERLKKENQGIQDKVMRLLDYVKIKQCVTRTEIKKWWNGDVE